MSSIYGIKDEAVDVLVEKGMRAIRNTAMDRLVLAGGVAANTRLRQKLGERCNQKGVTPVLTPMSYCTDNAAMIAGLGARLLAANGATGVDFSMDAYANLRVGSPRSYRAQGGPA